VAYVIPKDVWYVIPARVILRGLGIQAEAIKAMTLLPEKPRHPERYRFEEYREKWGLMDESLPGRGLGVGGNVAEHAACLGVRKKGVGRVRG
jgi:hypothetical protein